MQCVVYKSLKKLDYYLYIEFKDDFSPVPDSLLRMLGNLEKVVEFELHEDRKLAQVDTNQVRQQLSTQGYFLQMPSSDPHPLDV